MKLGNLDFNIGSINPSGIGVTIFRIAKAAITTWPTIVDDLASASGTDVGVLSTYDGDFVLATGEVWEKIYSTQGKGKATFEPTGEVDCKMFTNKLTLYYPKLTPALLAFSKAAVNGDYVYIFKHDGKYFVIGHKDYRVVTSPSGDTGDAAGSAKGSTIELEAPDVTPLPIYKGELALADGTLDCATDTFTPTPEEQH